MGYGRSQKSCCSDEFGFGQTKETIIHITTDNYPQETRWVLYADSMYGTMLGSVQYGYYTQSNTPHMDTLYIPDSLTNITFVIYDSYGDGMSPPGSYFVSICGDTIVSYPVPAFSNGLISNRTVPQCLAQPPPGPCIPTVLNINLDQFQGETTWEIHDSTGVLIAAGGPYTTAPNYQPQFENLCLPIGQISLTMYDSYGDGRNSGGTVTLYDADGNAVALNVAVNGALDGYLAVCLDRTGDNHAFADPQGAF